MDKGESGFGGGGKKPKFVLFILFVLSKYFLLEPATVYFGCARLTEINSLSLRAKTCLLA